MAESYAGSLTFTVRNNSDAYVKDANALARHAIAIARYIVVCEVGDSCPHRFSSKFLRRQDDDQEIRFDVGDVAGRVGRQ